MPHGRCSELLRLNLIEGDNGRMENQLRMIVDNGWRQFGSAQAPHIVRPAIPILYFGDLTAYQQSDIRIITVGLNPSSAEFPMADWFLRFPIARELVGRVVLTDSETMTYVDSLGSYFSAKPYRGWFDQAFGAILDGAGASFYEGRRVALHTDICSPLATDPTWSKLSTGERTKLLDWGVELWHELVEYLQLDLAIVSVARHYMDRIEFGEERSWKLCYRVARLRPYDVEISRRLFKTGKPCMFSFGRAAQRPFGTVGGNDKREIGKALVEALNA